MRMFIGFLIMFFATITAAYGQAEPSSMDKFMGEYYWIVGGVIVLVEYLIGVSKLKSNSMIDMVVNFFKMLGKK